MKILILGSGNSHYIKWIKDAEEVYTLKEADLVMFTGGEDVNPSIYNEARTHKYTQSNINRDLAEKKAFEKIVEYKIPIIGICRGSQLCTAMSGGKIIQHVNGHANGNMHEIITHDNKVFMVTSTHHQMMYPYTARKHEVLAVSNKRLSDVYFKNDVNTYDMKEEPEIVYYPHTNCLSIQLHPEMMHNEEPIVQYLNKLLKEKCFGKANS